MLVDRATVLLGFTACAVTQGTGFGTDNFGYGTYGPWSVPASEFDSFLDHGNATSNYPLEGRNISGPYPGVSSIDGWSWSISVAADIPIENSKSPNTSFFTGSRVNLNAPASLPRLNSSQAISVNKSWQMCVVIWHLGEAYNDKLREDDGSCSTIVSSECAKDIEDGVMKNYTSTNCLCPNVKSLSSCKNEEVLVRNGCEARSKSAEWAYSMK